MRRVHVLQHAASLLWPAAGLAVGARSARTAGALHSRAVLVFIAFSAAIWLLDHGALLARPARRGQPSGRSAGVDAGLRAPHRRCGRRRPSVATLVIVVRPDGAQLTSPRRHCSAHEGRRADHQSHRAPMVVGGRVRGCRSPSRTFTTANEIHIPVGEPVLVKLESTDVIHSFWVPSLAGKLDLIPGQRERISSWPTGRGFIAANAPNSAGCSTRIWACWSIAEAAADFEAGAIARSPPPHRRDPERERGTSFFLSKPCVMCHQVRGTSAGGKVAPDLTHFGSRRTHRAPAL